MRSPWKVAVAGKTPDAIALIKDAKVTVLSEMIKHHLKEEEKRAEGLIAQAREAGVDVEGLGTRMAERKAELLAEIKANGLPTPQARSFTGHELEESRPVG